MDVSRRHLIKLFSCIVAGCSATGRGTAAYAQYPDSDPSSRGRGMPQSGGSAALSSGGCMLSSASAAGFGSSIPLQANATVHFVASVMPIEAQLLAQVTQLSPGFSLFNDADAPNAYATPEPLLGRPDGSVLFGISLLAEQLYSHQFWGAAIAGIMAHEWGHIAQFMSGIKRPTPQMELQADFLAGWYMGYKHVNGFATVMISGLADSLYSKGDYYFWSEQHHGTPMQRRDAMMQGYDLARSDPQLQYQEALMMS